MICYPPRETTITNERFLDMVWSLVLCVSTWHLRLVMRNKRTSNVGIKHSFCYS